MFSGYFYTYHYDYKNPPDTISKLPKHILDIYDGRPVAYIFDVMNIKGHPYALGINFHFMPPKSRQMWLAIFKSLNGLAFDSNKRSKIKEKIMSAAYRKSRKAYRVYDFRKITYLQKIPNDKIAELMKYTPYTHEFKRPESIFNIYRQYGPSWNY